jgi:plastocyanin
MRRAQGLLCVAALAIALSAAADGAAATGAPGVIQGKVVCRAVRDCSGALVYVEKVPGKTFAPAPKAVMDQSRLVFAPHVLPVLTGTEVSFPNSDEVRHNVFSPSPTKRFNLGTYPRGAAKSVVFDKPGVVELLCNVHAEMSAFIVVIDTPYVAAVQSNGRYVLKDVPAGVYVVVAWHEQLKEHRQLVTVRDGETVTLNFDLRS